MKIAPEESSLLLLLSLVATFVAVGLSILVITGYIPINTGQELHTGTVDVSVSEENEEIKFEVTTMGNLDEFVVEEPDGTRTSLVRQGDSVAFKSEKGLYSIISVKDGVERTHQTVHPEVPNIDVSEHSRFPDGRRI